MRGVRGVEFAKSEGGVIWVNIFTKSTAGTTAQATAAIQVAGRAPKRRCGGCRGAAV